MPKITVDGKSGEFDASKRLVLAIEELGVNIGHRCQGNGRCTTCRVEMISGEPDTMTRAEYDKLVEKEMLGQARLSCQMLCSQDMEMTAGMTLESVEGWTDTGPAPDDVVMPEAVFIAKDELA